MKSIKVLASLTYFILHKSIQLTLISQMVLTFRSKTSSSFPILSTICGEEWFSGLSFGLCQHMIRSLSSPFQTRLIKQNHIWCFEGYEELWKEANIEEMKRRRKTIGKLEIWNRISGANLNLVSV